jgi:hypothetical protein
MKGRFGKNFIPLFNAFWYRDFPLVMQHKTKGGRAEWTTHIGFCVRACADVLGYFTHFEQGNRTDAVVRDNRGRDIAHIEWEWEQPFRAKVNEIQKLYKYRRDAEVSIFISYSQISKHGDNIATIERQWRGAADKLIVFLITFERGREEGWEVSGRLFNKLETYRMRDGRLKKLRTQNALPWRSVGTRWEDNTL